MPIGYADGVFRTLSGRINVLINGRLRPNVGRICMDQFVVDLGPDASDVSDGDEAILFGPGTDGEPTAQDWADLLGTIHYEVVTSPRGRVVRTYLRRLGGQAQPVSDNDPKRRRRKANAGLLAGAAGLAAVGTIAGVSVARSMTRRTTSEDPYVGEDFELLDADRSSRGDHTRRRGSRGARGRPRCTRR